MSSPYANLPDSAYWRSAVAQRAPLDPGNLYAPRFRIGRRSRIVTVGSCFAQHVGRTLLEAGFNVLDAEPLPVKLRDSEANRFGYRIFSARYGNVYTARQLLQLLREAMDEVKPSGPVWEKDGRFYDAFRPSVEPEGLGSPDEVLAHRAEHLLAVRGLLEQVDVFVFTFGLTEAWISKEDGTVYPTAPGTIAATIGPDQVVFHNCGFAEIFADFVAARKIIKSLSPKARFVITVSPVPLTATASGKHVEVATCYSKSTLRSVCGALTDLYPDIDYFPSFEVITSQASRGTYYEPNLRTVSKQGVATAMSLFMAAHDPRHGKGQGPDTAPALSNSADAARDEFDLVCEDALLDAFAP